VGDWRSLATQAFSRANGKIRDSLRLIDLARAVHSQLIGFNCLWLRLCWRLPSDEGVGGQLLDTNKHILGRSFLFMVACLCGCSAVFAETPVPKPVIVAYVFAQDNPIHPGEIAAQKLTRINYAFANIKSGRIVNDLQRRSEHDRAGCIEAGKPVLTVLVSVGGWLWSGAFSDMALTKESRGIFIASVVEFVRQHQLDGLDVDWEYPGLPGAEPHFRVEDKQNYTLLLKELRTRFNGLEKELHRPLYVTAATELHRSFWRIPRWRRCNVMSTL